MMLGKYGFTGMLLGAVLFSSACDDGDDGSTDEAGDGDGDGDETGDGDGDGDDDGGIKDPTEGDSDSNGDFGQDDLGNDDGSDDEGELEGCAVHESADVCASEAGCAPVFGQPLIDDGAGGWCTEADKQFIGCASSNVLCPGTGKTVCDGESVWWTTACVPDNLDVCEAPGELSGAC